MAILGKRNTLRILHGAPPGFYLDGGSHGEILLPGSSIPSTAVPGEMIDVFIYRDSEDRLIATTKTPLAEVGQFASLKVVEVHPRIGAFLDWGLEKDLLLPIREQTRTLRIGDFVIVHIERDEKTDRIVASARFNRRLDLTPPTFREGDQVKLLIASQTELGYAAIINQTHRGLIYRADLAGALRIGQQMDGYIRTIRPDGKIDLGLDRVGYSRIKPLTEQILDKLRAQNGRLPYHDNSSPEVIRQAFGVSKKAFKQALGSLYRHQSILIEPEGIRLAPTPVKNKTHK